MTWARGLMEGIYFILIILKIYVYIKEHKLFGKIGEKILVNMIYKAPHVHLNILFLIL